MWSHVLTILPIYFVISFALKMGNSNLRSKSVYGSHTEFRSSVNVQFNIDKLNSNLKEINYARDSSKTPGIAKFNTYKIRGGNI